MDLSTKPWGPISQADYKTAEEYCDACLVDMNAPGAEKVKNLCHLPVKEPQAMGGQFNMNGMMAAAAALAGARGGVQIPAAEKKKAARKLLNLYRQAQKEPPESIRRMAQ